MLRRVRRFFELPPRDRALLVRARLQLSLASATLTLGGLRRATTLIDRLNPPAAPTSAVDESARVRRTVELVDSASRFGPGGTCLTRSLVLRGLLRRQGIESTVRMGVRKEHAVEGHAWVEVAGHPINDTPDVHERYAPLPTEAGR